MKVLVKEGWVNQDTGKKSEPRIQFTLVQYLQDVLDDLQLTMEKIEEVKEQLPQAMEEAAALIQGS